ncbi:hypothetical protein I7I50_03160 [Histoplasma capsulatum G186AR]|uniref:Uncharacterized protein n=1 Tax=Ajellomyces capsulatus TaxID=5037 RepID=A0A8H7Z7F9_AJECA|nr:hypothetical protein I7I52_00171 [Histoplasma capsulatum]QSS72096.1 hypothetical protein I7I50_03160 [Histoplasma capsulatum G186AR]
MIYWPHQIKRNLPPSCVFRSSFPHFPFALLLRPHLYILPPKTEKSHGAYLYLEKETTTPRPQPPPRPLFFCQHVPCVSITPRERTIYI